MSCVNLMFLRDALKIRCFVHHDYSYEVDVGCTCVCLGVERMMEDCGDAVIMLWVSHCCSVS